MDPEYYVRQADQERRRLEGHNRAIATADAAVAKAETAADRAAADAARATSESSRRSKNSDAERRRGDARRAREARSKATAAVAKSQSRIHELDGKARQERARQEKRRAQDEKRAAEKARRDAAAASRAARLEAQRAAQRELLRDRQISDIALTTSQLEARLTAARRLAPRRITVLFIAGTIEGGEHALRLDREIKEIDTRLRASEYRDQVNFQTHQAARVGEILDAFNRHDPDVVHFSGHGSASSLLFEGADGRPHELSEGRLGLLLGAARKPIRLFVINACMSGSQALAATEFVDAAIGMDEPIDDEAAKVFAGQFYGALGAGNSLQVAFDQASAMARALHNEDETGRPHLYTRDGLDPSELVLVAPPDGAA